MSTPSHSDPLPASFKPVLFEQFARVAKAMANGQRLELLELLAQSEMTVETLARTLGAPVANASQHLKQLKHGGLVKARREGRHIWYSLASAEVTELLMAMQAVARQTLGEVDSMLSELMRATDTSEPIPVEDVMQRAERGLVTVLDVRPAHEFAAAHLPGAINIPLPELAQRLKELPADREVVAYCRGAYCVLSFKAVAQLRAAGYSARRVAEGIPAWVLGGLPLASTADHAH